MSCGILVEPVELKSPDANLCGVSSNAVAGSTHKVFNGHRYSWMSQRLSERAGMWNFSRTHGILVVPVELKSPDANLRVTAGIICETSVLISRTVSIFAEANSMPNFISVNADFNSTRAY